MAQRRLNNDYANREKWLKMAVTNTAMSGVFSSDRTIHEYNDQIWHLEPLRKPEPQKEPADTPKKEKAKPVRLKSGK